MRGGIILDQFGKRRPKGVRLNAGAGQGAAFDEFGQFGCNCEAMPVGAAMRMIVRHRFKSPCLCVALRERLDSGMSTIKAGRGACECQSHCERPALSLFSRYDPRYAIVFGACLTQFTIIGLLFAYSLFFKIFETEFGWSRTTLSACASLAFFMMGVLAIGIGRLSDRYGPKLVLGVAGALFGLGYAGISLVSEPWQLFLIFGLFIGLGMSSHDVVTLSTVARWFDKRRGMMSGVVKAGTAVGQIAVPPLAAFLIGWLGWQQAALALGLMASAALLLAAFCMQSPPKPAVTPTAKPVDAGWVFKSRTFWTLCAIQALFMPILTTIPLHIVIHGIDLGMSTATAAFLLSVIGAASIAGRLTVGTFADYIGGKRGMILCFVPLIIALGVLLFTGAPWALFVIMVFYGFGHGGLFTIVSPTIAEHFGTSVHGTIFGNIVFFGAAGGALGPILTGWVFDQQGSYDLAFISLGLMAATGLGLVLSLPKPNPEPS